MRDLQAYVLEHPEADLTVPTLARRVAMSPRNFARVFTREVGATPARFVTSARVETARRLLEESEAALETIAERCGLGGPEAMRRAFLRLRACRRASTASDSTAPREALEGAG